MTDHIINDGHVTPWTHASWADYLAHVRSEASQREKLRIIALALLERRSRELARHR